MKLLVLLALVSQAAAAPRTCKKLPEDGQLEVVINETDSGKCFKVADILDTLTVTSSSASEEVEDVDVTFSGAGGVLSFLAVGDGGNAKATTIAAEGDIDGDVIVGSRSGTAIDTNIAADSVGGIIDVGAYYGKATDTTIIAGSIKNRIYVGTDGGKAKNTNIAVSSSVSKNVYVGDEGIAINTNIAADSVSNVHVGYWYGGAATNTNITLGNGGKVINVHSGAKNTNIVNNGLVSVTIEVESGDPAETTCNGNTLMINVGQNCSCPGTCYSD